MNFCDVFTAIRSDTCGRRNHVEQHDVPLTWTE
jgi:hypothetical protein